MEVGLVAVEPRFGHDTRILPCPVDFPELRGKGVSAVAPIAFRAIEVATGPEIRAKLCALGLSETPVRREEQVPGSRGDQRQV